MYFPIGQTSVKFNKIAFIQQNAFENISKIAAIYGSGLNVLTYLPLVPRICVNESSQRWFR